jgi:hypothetical protein
MPRPLICRLDLDALLKKYAEYPQYEANGQCARLVQVLCPDAGPTSGWKRGERVIDVLPQLRPGTVVANFWFDRDEWRFPSRQGFHSGIYKQNGLSRIMPNGLPCAFTLIDQWPGKYPGERGLAHVTPEMAKRDIRWAEEANNADDFYVVMV